jgi:hypothetical protein
MLYEVLFVGVYILTFTYLDSNKQEKTLWTTQEQEFPDFNIHLIP